MSNPAVMGGTIALWMCLSMGVIFFNAALLQTYRHPIALTCWHMVVSCMLVAVIQIVSPGLLYTGDDANGIAPLSLRRSVELGMPVALMAAIALATSNTAYLHLTVAFIQMVKAWTSSCVYITGCFMGTQKWSVPVAKTLALITFGLTIASAGELKFSLYGFVMQVIALIAEAVRINMLEIRLKSAGYKLNPLSSMKIFSPLIMILLGTALVVLDPSALDIEKIAEVGWGPFALNGMVACGLNLAVFLVIKIASGLIFALSGVVKDFLIITGSAVFKGETISTMQMVGYVIAVLGLQMYAAVSKAPADFEAGVLPELFRRIKELVMPPATSGEGVKKKDVAAAKEEELQGIIGATTDNEDEDPKQNVFKTGGDALDDDQP